MSIVSKKSASFSIILGGLLAACTPTSDTATTETSGPWAKSGNTYAYDVTYDRPNGVSEDTFQVTLDSTGMVTAAQAVLPGDGGKHEEGLVRFNEALSPVIVGKKLSDVGDFDTLGQYSLTTAAFNDALDLLKTQVAAM